MTDDLRGDKTSADAQSLRVLLYSSNAEIRQAVRMALGTQPDPKLPPLEFVEVATYATVVTKADEGGFDLFIFDGEATKFGGMGLCRQLKNELDPCPPVLVLIGRAQDAWLASWSEADAVVEYPLDPIVVSDTVVGMLRDVVAVKRAS